MPEFQCSMFAFTVLRVNAVGLISCIRRLFDRFLMGTMTASFHTIHPKHPYQ